MKTHKFKYALMLLMVLSTYLNKGHANYDAGISAFQNGDFIKAQSEWASAAAKGDLNSQYQLAIMLLAGKYCEKDEPRAKALLNEAANKGNPDASYAIYVIAIQDKRAKASELIKLLEAAAAKGSKTAESRLDVLHAISFQEHVSSLIFEQESWLPVSFSSSATSLRRAERLRGQSVYEKTCIACHANGLMKAPALGDKSRWRVLAGKGLDNLSINAIRGVGYHPPKGGDLSLTNDEVREATYFMLEASQ